MSLFNDIQRKKKSDTAQQEAHPTNGVETKSVNTFSQWTGCAVTDEIDLLTEARALIVRKQYEPAAVVLAQYVQIHPEDVQAYKKLLTIYLHLDKEGHYVQTLSELVHVHPNDPLLSEGIEKGIRHSQTMV